MTRTPGRPARNRIDAMIERFQHRWETDRQFRATWGSVIALCTVVMLCACVSVVGVTTNRVLASAGLVSSGSSSPSASLALGTGTKPSGTAGAAINEQFPTPTSTPGTSAPVPSTVAIPASGTPLPSPTIAPTATAGPDGQATPTATGGGGDIYNGRTPVCSGPLGNGTWSLSPCPLVHGQGGSLIIADPNDAGKQVNIVVNFGQCSGNAQCTFLSPPTPSVTLDSGGNLTLNMSVPKSAQPGVLPVTGMINISGGAQTTFVSYTVK